MHTLHSLGLLWTSDQSVVENSDDTRHSQETDIYALGRIRAHSPNKRAAADPHLRHHVSREKLRGTGEVVTFSEEYTGVVL